MVLKSYLFLKMTYVINMSKKKHIFFLGLYTNDKKAIKMDLQVKVLAAMSYNWCSTSKTHMVEGKN